MYFTQYMRLALSRRTLRAIQPYSAIHRHTALYGHTSIQHHTLYIPYITPLSATVSKNFSKIKRFVRHFDLIESPRISLAWLGEVVGYLGILLDTIVQALGRRGKKTAAACVV